MGDKRRMNDLKGIIEDCNKSDLVSDKVIKKIIEIIGQEEWQDLHDENSDICTTMGELIITLDRIADLEKENAELQDKLKNLASVAEVRLANWQKCEKENKELKIEKIPQLERKIASIRGCHKVDLAKLNARTEQVERLKKENAELKNKLKHRNCLDCSNHSSKLRMRNLDLEKENAELKDDNKVMADNYSKMEQKFYDNLTKAKDLLNEFMRISKASDEDFEHDYSELIGEAEQFLNSEVEK